MAPGLAAGVGRAGPSSMPALGRAACARRGTRRCAPSPRRGRCGRRRGRRGRRSTSRWSVGALAPRQLEHGVEPACGSSRAPCSARACARAGRSPCSTARTTSVGHAGGLEGVDALAVVVGGLALVVRRRAPCGWRPSAAQEELALLLLEPVGTSLRILLGQLELGQGLLGPAEHQRAPARSTSTVSSSSTLRSMRQVGPPAGEVGQARRVVGRRRGGARRAGGRRGARTAPAAWPAARRRARWASSVGAGLVDRLGLRATGRRRCRRRRRRRGPGRWPARPGPGCRRGARRWTRWWRARRRWRSGRRPGARAASSPARRRRPRRRPWPRRTRARW